MISPRRIHTIGIRLAHHYLHRITSSMQKHHLYLVRIPPFLILCMYHSIGLQLHFLSQSSAEDQHIGGRPDQQLLDIV